MKNLFTKAISLTAAMAILLSIMMTGGLMAGAANVSLIGGCHVQNYGNRPIVTASAGNSLVLGTTGQGLRLESYHLRLSGISGNIVYQSHVQNIGDQSARKNGAISGTQGQSLRIEGVSMYLTGAAANSYKLEYRTHVQNIGWTSWCSERQFSGTRGRSLRVEAIEVRLVPKKTTTTVSTSSTSNSYKTKTLLFTSESKFRHGASWAASKRPTLSTYSGSGCCAYAADFVKYVYGKNSPRSGIAFYNVNQIRTGDVIVVKNSQHWFVVLERNGNRLTTAEGNWGGKVVVSSSTYTIVNNQLYRNGRYFRPLSVGYHYM